MVRRFALFVPATVAALMLALVLLAEGEERHRGWSVSPLARTVSLLCAIASLIAAVAPKRSDVRLQASVALATLAVTAIGQSRMNDAPGGIYRVGCVIFAFTVIYAIRSRDRIAPVRALPSDVKAKPRVGAILTLGFGWLAATVLLVTQLPPAGRAVERRVVRYFEGYEAEDEAVGFSTGVQLGSVRGMFKSSKVVMRIDGEPVDYLRGVVLDDYDVVHQRWSSTLDDVRVDFPANASETEASTRIRMARYALLGRGREARWFVPAEACLIHTNSRHVLMDRGGILHLDTPTIAGEISFRAGDKCTEAARQSARALLAMPSPVDLAISPRLSAELLPIAEDWTRGLSSDRAKLDAIARQLARFEYSLDVKRSREVDAVVDLLTIHRQGHCELFASSMALLGRTQRIPMRLVSGYRVSEFNPVTRLGVVRERNAHTWVEGWVDGKWEMWDPTPAVETVTRARASVWEHLTELFAWGWDRAATAFSRIGLVHVGVGAAGLAIVLLGVRRLSQQQAKRVAADRAVAARSLPAFDTLSSALENAGWVRTASEPVERFAKRVGESGEVWSQEVAEVLLLYADLRYGEIGEEVVLSERLSTLARKVGLARSASV